MKVPLRSFAGQECKESVRISNAARVVIENLTITNQKPLDKPPVELRNDQQVVIRNLTVKGTEENGAPVKLIGCTDVKIERVTCNGAAVEKPVVSTQKKKDKNPDPQPKQTRSNNYETNSPTLSSVSSVYSVVRQCC